MDKYILDALKYIYLSNKKAIESGKFKGLHLKECLLFNKQIDELADKIKFKKITDFEEVMCYGKQ